MPYVVERWLGGTFTNFPTILKVTKRLTHLKQERASGNLEKYTKKEQLEFNEEIARLEKLVGGIERMTKLPEAIFVIDIKQEKTAVREASKVKIPIVAVVDTNVSPEGITYPIPANDDATKSIQLLTDAIVEAIEEGKELAEERLAAQPVTPPPTEASAPPAPESSSKEIPVVAKVVSDTSEAEA
jgi:small subunit ribosomal protein S2